MTVQVPGGRRRDILLGKYDSPESRAEYARVVAEMAVPGSAAPPAPRAADLTVNELLVKFMRWALIHYRHPDGRETTEADELRRSLSPVKELYGHTPAAGFGPKALAAVRHRTIQAGWCRSLVNRRVDRVRRAFKWATAEELVPVATYQALRTVTGLRKGRTDARESEPVGPVDPARVDATLPFLSRHARGLVQFCRLTGCRPGEACALTRGQIDATADPWVYRPTRHKTAHRGKVRAIPLGPKARALLDEFPTTGPDDPVFSPRLAREGRYAAMRAARTSKVQPSQTDRKRAKPARSPAARYTNTALAQAVGKASGRAGVGHWHPGQLRHLFATQVRRVYGLEAAGASLGHAKMSANEVYAERDQSLAARVAVEIG